MSNRLEVITQADEDLDYEQALLVEDGEEKEWVVKLTLISTFQGDIGNQSSILLDHEECEMIGQHLLTLAKTLRGRESESLDLIRGVSNASPEMEKLFEKDVFGPISEIYDEDDHAEHEAEQARKNKKLSH